MEIIDLTEDSPRSVANYVGNYVEVIDLTADTDDETAENLDGFEFGDIFSDFETESETEMEILDQSNEEHYPDAVCVICLRKVTVYNVRWECSRCDTFCCNKDVCYYGMVNTRQPEPRSAAPGFIQCPGCRQFVSKKMCK